GRLVEIFREEHGIALRDEHPAAFSRIWWAAEEAKKRLSFEHYVKVREDALISGDGAPLHLDVEIARADYEEMIRPLVESTIESVAKAMDDAGKRPGDLDAVLLVGGSTRTPLVAEILEERTGLVPRQEVHPDLCVALGAGVLAARLSGEDVERVLVDVSPYSFGPSYLEDRDGYPYPYCYKPIIRRNTPLPITRTERYSTAAPYQTVVEVEVFQGEDPDAMKNIRVGRFRIEGLTPMAEPNEIVCRLALDIDGILHVTAIEKCTGKSKHIAISNAIPMKDENELADGRARIESLYATRFEEEAAGSAPRPASDAIEDGEALYVVRPTDAAAVSREGEWARFAGEARALVERVRGLFAKLHDQDREEAVDLNERVEAALEARDAEALSAAVSELKELVFFVEGR
ncbi:MAG: Hsp70 family protein, partial [Planctomycetes bacterium]|nr:Hsp70 family protein [Planctomycetota bacterium]